MKASQIAIHDGINCLVNAAHDNAKAKGFWDENKDIQFLRHIHILDRIEAEAMNAALDRLAKPNLGERIALVHSELSEALEGVRKNVNAPSDHIPEFTALEEELADVIIRIGDLAGGMRLRLADAIIAKMAFNSTRPHKHGKQF